MSEDITYHPCAQRRREHIPSDSPATNNAVKTGIRDDVRALAVLPSLAVIHTLGRGVFRRCSHVVIVAREGAVCRAQDSRARLKHPGHELIRGCIHSRRWNDLGIVRRSPPD